ncbi:MAG: hypothetical protein ACREBH_02030 [Candidatus Micrarchaeaceae archaeon]
MLFGKTPQKEEIDASDLTEYLDRCLDDKLKRLSTREPEIEKDLSDALSSFGKAVEKFSESKAEPSMEYLYGIKESYPVSQKPKYASSLIHIASSHPEYGGKNIYFKAESMVESYKRLTHEVLKANSTFKIVMMAYSADLSDLKSSFSTMEKLCKDLGSELNASSRQLNEYMEIDNKIRYMFERMSRMEQLVLVTKSPGIAVQHDGTREEISGQIHEKEKELALKKGMYNETSLSIARILLPIERIAKKHDHISSPKRKLTDYIREPSERIRTEEDIKEINSHISAIIDEVVSGKTEEKNTQGLISKLNAAKSADLMAMSESLRKREIDVRILESSIAALRAQLHELEKATSARMKTLEEKAEAEKEINMCKTDISSKKSELEKLFRDYYRRHVTIKVNLGS